MALNCDSAMMSSDKLTLKNAVVLPLRLGVFDEAIPKAPSLWRSWEAECKVRTGAVP